MIGTNYVKLVGDVFLQYSKSINAFRTGTNYFKLVWDAFCGIVKALTPLGPGQIA